MIQVENLVKEFDGLRALDGLCLNVPDGCVYGLVGPNGAGKTTVIRHLTGVYRQDSGCVRIDGQPVYENPAVKRRIACIPDELYARGSETIPRYDAVLPPSLSALRRGAFSPARRGLCTGRKTAPPPVFQGYAEAGRILAGHFCRPGYLIIRRAGRWSRPRHAPSGVEHRHGRYRHAGWDERARFPRTICASWRTYATMSHHTPQKNDA